MPLSSPYYAEGTWTPSLGAVTTPPTGVTGSATGRWTRIGRMVVASGRLTLTSKGTGGVGQATIEGLPFTIGAISPGGAISHTNTSLSASTILGMHLAQSTTRIALTAVGNTGRNDLAWSTLSDTFDAIFSVIYTV